MKTYIAIAKIAEYLNRMNTEENLEKYPLAASTISRLDGYLHDMEKSFNGGGLEDMSINIEKSNEQKITFSFDYHCMNDAGYYDGYLSINGAIKAKFGGYDIKLALHRGNRKYYDTDYFYDCVMGWLDADVDYSI